MGCSFSKINKGVWPRDRLSSDGDMSLTEPRRWISRPTVVEAFETFRLEGTVLEKGAGQMDFRMVLDYDLSHPYLVDFAKSMTKEFPHFESSLYSLLAIRKQKLEDIGDDDIDNVRFDEVKIIYEKYIKDYDFIPIEMRDALKEGLDIYAKDYGVILDRIYTHIFHYVYGQMYLLFIRSEFFCGDEFTTSTKVQQCGTR